MNKVKILTAVSVILFLSNLAIIGFGFYRKPPPKDKGPKNMVIEKLHFDANQIAAYDTLIMTHQGAIKSKNQEILDLKKELYNTLNLPSSPSQKDSLLLKISIAQNSIEQTHYTHFEGLKGLCKENQRQYFEQLTKELTDHFGSTKKEKRQ